MPEHLRALIVILALALPVFWAAQRVLCPVILEPKDFARRRNLWLGITLAAFLSHNYWLFLAIASVLLLWGSSPQRERNPMALFFFLILAVPAFSGGLPGLGLFQHLFEVNHIRLLTILVLFPAAIRLMREPSTPPLGRFAADWFLLGYLTLQVVLYFGVINITQTMRATFYLVVDMVLIYYVASRSISNLHSFRDVTTSFCVAMLLVAPAAIFEFGKHWLLYSSLSPALGLPWDYGSYLGRESLLRATGPAGHSLALGYSMAVGFGLWLGLQRTLSPVAWWGGAILLGAGLVAPVSRGPWVGSAAIVLVVAAMGQHAGPRMLKLSLAAIVAVGVLALTPYGEKLVDYLPFVGSVDAGGVTYRSRLFEVSLFVISMNPFFGSPNFMANPLMEQMRQGQGIIDLVNSYIGVTLSSGIVGLLLFSGILVASLLTAYRATRIAGSDFAEAELFGRALTAVLIGVLLMIATVSSILAIPTIYWALAGLGVAYGAMDRNSNPSVAIGVWNGSSARLAGAPNVGRFAGRQRARRDLGT